MLRAILPVPVALTLLAAAAARGDEPPPQDVGLRERVEVQLVLVDVLVLDRRNRTVPDLTAADFELLVDGKAVPIHSLDVRYPIGAAGDARAGGAPALAAAEGRAVLAFDWIHMEPAGRGRLHAYDALRAATRAVESGMLAASEIMVVSLGDGLRVEPPFTADRDAVLRTLRRIEGDPWIHAAGPGLSEFGYFRRLLALLDLMERVPGRKVIVLFSGPVADDGWTHDNEYERLAALSSTSRTSIYPVDSGGLRTRLDPFRSRLGGPPMLHRLADETGGRMTADTNDLALGPARASRDLACAYTLGFRDPAPKLDDPRRLVVRIPGRTGARALHPDAYVVRSPAERARSLLETASFDPASFRNDVLRVGALVSAAGPGRKRDVTLSVTLEPEDSVSTFGERELRGFVRQASGAIVHRFERCMVPGETAVLDSVALRPGRYTVSAVLEDPDRGEPVAAVTEFEVPEASEAVDAVPPGSGR